MITNARISIIPYPAVPTPYIRSQVEPSSINEEKTIQYVSFVSNQYWHETSDNNAIIYLDGVPALLIRI